LPVNYEQLPERTNPPILEPTMTKRSLTLILPLFAALLVACGTDLGIGPESSPRKLVLTKLEVTPSNDHLVPEGTLQLTTNALDQFGAKMLDDRGAALADKATYVSSAPEIAAVDLSGLVTAIEPGVATITVSLEHSGVTLTDSMVAQVDTPTATSAILTATADLWWFPYAVRVKAPATVTWVVPAGVQAPTVWLNPCDANAEKLAFVDSVATRTFSTPGSYYYGDMCSSDLLGVITVY
jgi:plastocyanin